MIEGSIVSEVNILRCGNKKYSHQLLSSLVNTIPTENGNTSLETLISTGPSIQKKSGPIIYLNN